MEALKTLIEKDRKNLTNIVGWKVKIDNIQTTVFFLIVGRGYQVQLSYLEHHTLHDFRTIEEVFEFFKAMKSYKFWDNTFMPNNYVKLATAVRNAWNEAWEQECSTCYVCLNDNKESKSPCNHDLCGECKQKMYVEVDIDDDDNIEYARFEYKCGVCRKVFQNIRKDTGDEMWVEVINN